MEQLLTDQQVAAFRQDGFLVVRGFYDREKQLEPIARGIHQVIGLTIARHGLEVEQPEFSFRHFDAGFQDIIRLDRKIGAEVYDAVKQVPAFLRLVADERHEQLLQQLRGTPCAGVAAGGYGIRIDNPFEEKFRAPWHQEYPAQLRSLDGLTFWTGLVPVTPEMGPVQFAAGSHQEGLVRVHTRDPRNPDKSGAYALTLEHEEERLSRYRREAPVSQPGDLVIIDFLVLHASGSNRGTRSRWTIQSRYFNFRDPTGMRIGWRGAFASGVDFRTIHPELVVE